MEIHLKSGLKRNKMKGFKNTWVEGVHYDVIPQSEISKINKEISEDSTLNVNYKPERMYSEQEVIKLVDGAFHMYASSHRHDAREWFVGQFKKK